MPQLNSDEAATDEPTTYTTEECEEEQRWHNDADLNDIKGDLVEESDCDERPTNINKTHSHGEASSKDVLDRDSRDEIKGPGRTYLYPHDIGSIVSSLHPSTLFNGVPPNGKVPYPYSMPYHPLLYGASPSPDIDSKTGLPRSHHPDIPSMYSLPGQLGQIPHPLAPWHAPPLYPICTASTMASILRYPHHPFAAFTTSAAVAASSMPRFPMGAHPHNPGMHPTMIPHPALVSNGPLSNMGNVHPSHNKMDQDKPSGRHSKSEHSGHGHSKRDRPYVKKPLNAFMLYMKEQRAKVVAECTLKESAAINQILGRKWHSLSREEQQKYYELARKERQLHLQMYPGWSARDNYGKRKKRKKEKSQGECTAQNPKKCRAVFGLEQQQLWCAPCRRKKKCIRYQHDDDSDEDDIASPGSPSYQGPYSHQGMQFDSIRSTSPLSLTSQSVVANGSSYVVPQTSSTSRLHSNHVSPQQQPPHHSHMPVNGIKQELRTSPLAIDGQPSMTNGGKGFEPYSGRKGHRAPSSENSFKSEGSPHSQGAGSNSSHGNHNHRSNLSANRNNGNNNNNNCNSADDILDRHVELSIPSSDAMNRRSSLDTNGLQRSMSRNGEPVRKSNSFEESDMPGTSGIVSGSRHHPPSSLRHHNTSVNSNTSADSPNSSAVRTHHRTSSKLSNGPSTPHMQHHPSPLHTPSGSLFLPPNSGPSPLLSPTYNHPSPNGSHFLPYTYFNPSMLAAAFGPPPSPMGLIGLSSFKSMSNSSLGVPIGGHSSGSSGSNQARVTSGAAVEGKS